MPARDPRAHPDLFSRCLEGVVVIFDRLESEELLAALPSCAIARRNHLAALQLLTEVEAEVRGLLVEMPADAG